MRYVFGISVHFVNTCRRSLALHEHSVSLAPPSTLGPSDSPLGSAVFAPLPSAMASDVIITENSFLYTDGYRSVHHASSIERQEEKCGALLPDHRIVA